MCHSERSEESLREILQAKALRMTTGCHSERSEESLREILRAKALRVTSM